jgi:hypothetical protein
MESTPGFPVEQCLTLNAVARIIASRRNLSELLHDLAERLHSLLDFSHLSVMLDDPAQHVMRLHNLQGSPRGPLRPGAEFAVEDIPSGWVWQHQQPLVLSDGPSSDSPARGWASNPLRPRQVPWRASR